MQSRRGFITAIAFTALGICSCSKEEKRKPTFAVTGKVTDGSKPIANATVIFHPVVDEGPDAIKPRGTTQADGSFKLTTYLGDDGAPSGEYRVTVEQWLSSGRPDEGPSNRLPTKFARPETSGLTATVGNGPTELKTFELKK